MKIVCTSVSVCVSEGSGTIQNPKHLKVLGAMQLFPVFRQNSTGKYWKNKEFTRVNWAYWYLVVLLR